MAKNKQPAPKPEVNPDEIAPSIVADAPSGPKLVDNTDAEDAPEVAVETQEVELSNGMKQVNYL